MSSLKPDGGAAFPRPYSHTMHGGSSFMDQSGMSLRDYFAGQYLQGVIAHVGFDLGDIATSAYAAADKMIAERNKR